MGITGARWGLESAEAVLKLRALRTSADWDEYWQFHLEQEHSRNTPPRSSPRVHPRSRRAAPMVERVLLLRFVGGDIPSPAVSSAIHALDQGFED